MAHVAIKCKISIFFAIMKPVGIKKSKMHKKNEPKTSLDSFFLSK